MYDTCEQNQHQIGMLKCDKHFNEVFLLCFSSLSFFPLISTCLCIQRLHDRQTFVTPILKHVDTGLPLPTEMLWESKPYRNHFGYSLYANLGGRDRIKLPSYKNRLLFFHMNTLEERRTIARKMFVTELPKRVEF